ncbi:sugar-binding transcriptional regulator [Gleimia europaea]|uniref:Sugar-binding domain-containing protein n=1 Tax=Gleimia europaea ACS-120-V-Col10b TaxID=883069 RepID=A0A9W5RD62_9ACTO|nr:sugar-binding domain-containing protein [Gleimia europaea]EPD29557.1 hypothetical protein HMPREF9238_01538 [Gleimia europaea ACS-120-V-Col10b]
MNLSSNDDLLMVRAAELYYNDGYNQSQVADRLMLSRWQVGRLLEKARETGLVEIRIHHPASRRRDLESALRNKFGDVHPIVVDTQATQAATLNLAARVAANHVAELRPAPSLIGLSWGRSVSAIANALPNNVFHKPVIVQLNGSALSVELTVDAASIIATVAKRSVQPTTLLLPAPAIAGSQGLVDHFFADPHVQKTIELGEKADLAIYSLGALTPNSVLAQSGSISTHEQITLKQRGCVGDILGHYIDNKGAIVDLTLEARTISINLESLRDCDRALAIAIGSEKSEVTFGALHAGLCRTLITESAIAKRVLEMGNE